MKLIGRGRSTLSAARVARLDQPITMMHQKHIAYSSAGALHIPLLKTERPATPWPLKRR